MLRTRIRTAASLLVVFVVLTARPTAACAGPVEDYAQVLLNDRVPDLVVLRYGYGSGRRQGGLLISHDGGHAFALTCSAAIAPSQNLTAALLGADGLIALGTFDGLLRDDGHGCDFRADPVLAGRWITDLVADPRDPAVTFALASTSGAAGNGLFRSAARGRFEPLGRSDDALLTRLRVVARRDGGLRFYVSAIAPAVVDPVTNTLAPPDYRLRVSDDEGATWREHALAARGGIVRLQAVDPGEPDRVLISVERSDAPDELLISEDGGASFAPYLEVVSVGGLVIMPDGRLFIGDGNENDGPPGAGGGLWRAASFGAPLERVTAAYPVHCLGRAADGSLLACQRLAFGAVDPDSGAFTQRFAFDEVEQLVSCPGSDVRALCQAPLLTAYCGLSHFPCAPMCDDYGVDLSPLAELAKDDAALAQCLARRGFAAEPPLRADAGTPPASAGQGEPLRPEPPRAARGGRCAVGASGARSRDLAGWAAWPVCALLALALRRVRRRAQRQRER